MTDISNTGSNLDSKFLRIGEGEKAKFKLLETKIRDPVDQKHSATILVQHDGKEKQLNLPTVLLRQLQANIEEKNIKVGSVLIAMNLGKPKGKTYFSFKLELVKK